MSSLTDFLKGNVREVKNEEVIVSKRFGPENNPTKWIIRQLTAKENKNLRRKYTKKIKDKLGRITEEFDSEKYQEDYMVRSIVFPDLSDAELQKSWGALGEYDLLEKMLTADELANLQIKISGFVEEEIVEDSLENQIEEVKNV